MKRIERHRAILGVDDKATLSDLKKVYRKIMMEWHPDKFQDSEESKKLAEEKSTKLIASYHNIPLLFLKPVLMILNLNRRFYA